MLTDKIVSKLQMDKLLHFIVGTYIFIIFNSLLSLDSVSKYAIPLSIVVFVTVLKELFDAYRQKSWKFFEYKDIIATCLGGILAMITTII